MCQSNNQTVADVVRAIAEAQTDVISNTCDTSCERSIRDLLGPVNTNDLDTVPFILYCEGDCQPFKAYGADIQNTGTTSRFDCVSSFIFRVSEVRGDNTALLELLTFGPDPQAPGNQTGAAGLTDPCAQIDGQSVRNLQGSDICITVNLDCFCGITCLPAVDLF